jgi:hypothetical protein
MTQVLSFWPVPSSDLLEKPVLLAIQFLLSTLRRWGLERLQVPLRRTYLKLQMELPHLSPELLLDCAVKTNNDSANLNGLFPALLTF